MSSVFTRLGERLRGCRGVLIDSNVILDVATNDPKWSEWSGNAIAECAERTILLLNPIIYAEVSIGYASIESLDTALPAAIYRREALPWEAGFLAGKAFLAYKQRGGLRTAPLPDIYIAAHAAIERLAILTRDVARYRSYFPTIEILSP